MPKELIAPLMLTDRPWAEIEAETQGPPMSSGPLFGNGDYQDNMIVRKADRVIMGFVDGHISGKPVDRAGAAAASAIEARNTAGQLIEILVINGDLYEVV